MIQENAIRVDSEANSKQTANKRIIGVQKAPLKPLYTLVCAQFISNAYRGPTPVSVPPVYPVVPEGINNTAGGFNHRLRHTP